MSNIIKYADFNVELDVDITNDKLMNNVKNEDVMRYLKMVFTNKERFISRFLNKVLDKRNTILKLAETNEDIDVEGWGVNDLLTKLSDLYDDVEPYTYSDAFKINDENFMSIVFGNIDIVNMIAELGHERIKTDGIVGMYKQYDKEGNYLGTKEINNIYEVHKVNCSKIGLDEDAYALKCWCTTTNDEHWLWIDDKFKDDPLNAVASTFYVHEKLIPFISEIKRQGDVLLVELTDEGKKIEITDADVKVSLTKEQYFNLLTAQT